MGVREMRRIAAAISFVAAFAVTAPAQGQARSEVAEAAGAAERQQLELAGVRIGMAAREVAPLLVAAGYRPFQGGVGLSWDGSVADRARQRGVRLPATDRVPSWASFVKGEEYVEVQYRQTPTGAVVSEVSYTINAEAIAPQRFRAVLLARYGRSGWDNGGEVLYCSRGERVCNQWAYVQGLQHPSIFVMLGGHQHRITLKSGGRIEEAHEAALRAEVDRRAPRMRSPTF